MLLTFIVRRAVCGLSPKNYNNFFLSMIASLDNSGWSFTDFCAFLRKQTAESSRFPRDEAFAQALATKPLYQTLGPARCRALLSNLELHKRGKKQEISELPDDLTVEHILPVTWQTHWPMENGFAPSAEDLQRAIYSVTEDDTPVGMIVRRNRLKHSLGNLTLVTQSFNSGVSNLNFMVKRREFEEHALLMLNKDFVKTNDWNETTIEARGRSMSQLALQIWPELPSTAA